jgi:hypothetical protein
MIFFSVLSLRRVLVCFLAGLLIGSNALAQGVPPLPKPVPRLAVVPMPYQQASFQRDGVEITRYHFGQDLNRPFLFPVIGPSGRSLTRMGHPRDPESHSHHNSVWISHNDVEGVSFWSDGGKGRIRHKRIVKLEDGGESSSIVTENEWVTTEGGRLLDETRQVTVLLREGKEWLMVIDMELKAVDKAVTLGKTPFGMIGVRMGKTIGVNDGGGRIRNSEGGVNEKEIFWKQARWVDYCGAITDGTIEGVTLFDHPKNVNFPSFFHVRNDGWMGASLTFEGPRTIEADKPLRLRYGLYVHGEMKPIDAIEAQWKKFAELGPLTNLEGRPQEK